MSIYPHSETARELLIWNFLSSGKFSEARQLAGELKEMNPLYEPAAKLLAAANDSISRKRD